MVNKLNNDAEPSLTVGLLTRNGGQHIHSAWR